MAVYEYSKGQHLGGFIGFRVCISFGHSYSFRQKYFSLKKLKYEDAKKQAEELEKKWQLEAIATKKVIRLTTKPRFSKPNTIFPGFRANIIVDKKNRGGVKKSYFRPVFVIQSPKKEKSDCHFPIIKFGFHAAYVKAMTYYAEVYSLSDQQKLSLIAKQPARTIFTGYLLQDLKKKGHKLTKKDLLEMLE